MNERKLPKYYKNGIIHNVCGNDSTSIFESFPTASSDRKRNYDVSLTRVHLVICFKHKYCIKFRFKYIPCLLYDSAMETVYFTIVNTLNDVLMQFKNIRH